MCHRSAAANLIDVHLVRHAREQSGIQAFARGQAPLGGSGELPLIGLRSLNVPDSAWKPAHNMVGTLAFGSKRGDEDDAIERWRVECPG